MYEVDFLPVGEGGRSGDAIAMRFTRPDNGQLAHVVIDGGFQDDGTALVEHFKRYYETEQVDLVILTHPDGDHIGGLGKVLEGLDVVSLAAHDLSSHGGTSLPAAAAVKELRELATAEGTQLYEPFQGLNAFGGALVVAGPSKEFYEARVAEEVAQESSGARATAPTQKALSEAVGRFSARLLQALPVEIPFGDSGGTNPRNNSSAIVNIQFGENRFLFTADAGVPALDSALDYLDSQGLTTTSPGLVQIPHHGSRHNVSSDLLNRLLGEKTDGRRGSACVSISKQASEDPRYPSPRVTNAFGRRGYPCFATEGSSLCHSGDGAPNRGWTPMTPIPAQDESIDDRS